MSQEQKKEQGTKAGGDAHTKGVEDAPGDDQPTREEEEKTRERAGGDAHTKGIS
jgi:hypothetical protein